MTDTGSGSLVAYLYCIFLSRMLTDMPLMGGALYICGRVITLALDAAGLMMLSRRWRIAGLATLGLMLVLNVAELLFLPADVSPHAVWLMVAIILTMTLRDVLGRRMIRREVRRHRSERGFYIRYGVLQLIIHLIGASLLLGSVDGASKWLLALGYMLTSVMEIHAQMNEHYRLRNPEEAADRVRLVRSDLQKSHAFAAYEAVSGAVLAALQLTQIVMYTFLAITTEEQVKYMVIGVVCTLLAREMTERIMKRRKKPVEPVNMLVIGLFLWLYGIYVFRKQLYYGAPDMTSAYFCMGMCAAGATMCNVCLNGLEGTMHAVARFATGRRELQPMRSAHRATGNIAILIGQFLALITLTLLHFFGPDLREVDFTQLALTYRPVMLAPALLTVVLALWAALRFPLSDRYIHKLRRFLQISENGGENNALKRQLERVIMHRHTQPLFVRMLMAMLRPFYRHTIIHEERIVQDESNPTVFLCNHGEFYGPVVGTLYIPVPLRAWVISDIMIDKEETAAYVNRFTISQQKWIPEKLQMPIARLVGRLSVMVMNQLETIPVYRNKLTQLKTTFRLSVEAMEAGDNLLIFPENPDADPENPGYAREGVGDLFAGFVMLAQVYYAKTGKRCRFQPMFAHKGMRTLTFCEPVLYDPENDAMAERDRIVAYAKEQMTQAYLAQEARMTAKQGGHDK